MRPDHRNPDAGADYLHRLGVRFSATVPITSQMVADAGAGSGGGFMPLGGAGEASPAAVGIPTANTGHATNVHVAMWLLGAGGIVAFFHLGGFRFAFDVGLGR